MPTFETVRHVRHSPEQMFALVADIERYPEFVPMCERLTVRSRRERAGVTLLAAEMTVGYKAISETFITQVVLKPAQLRIDVRYVEGPFRHLDNRWAFVPTEEGGSDVEFFIDYEFRNRILGALMGTVFDRAFRMFTEAFEKRADAVYGVPGAGAARSMRN